MREVVFNSEGKKDRTGQRSTSTAESPVVILSSPPPRAPSRKSSPTTVRRPPQTNGKLRRLRDFLVSYDGKFLAHFRAPRPLLPRAAFAQVAREMRSKVAHFDIEKLTLHRPVKLRVGKPSNAESADRGELSWFGK